VVTLVKVARLLQTHADDLASFLTADPKGRLVPGLIINLAAHLQQERDLLAHEQEQVARNLEHIKQIVSMQQNYAKVSGVLEKVAVSSLVDDALQMNFAGLARHGIRLRRNYAAVPPVLVDRHKVLQILVNFVHNAKYAMDQTPKPDRMLTASIGPGGGGKVKISIQDTGMGIPRENLTKIFSHGFTTRQSGHGFGLHSGANAAKEMGGELTVHSDGPGLGATFTLELPLADPLTDTSGQRLVVSSGPALAPLPGELTAHKTAFPEPARTVVA
jgi:signal transduction histidine kinase